MSLGSLGALRFVCVC